MLRKPRMLFGLGIRFNKFVTVLLPFFFRRLLPKQRELFQQIRDLILLAAFPQSLDQVIERRLILGINLESFPGLYGCFRILSRLQIEFRQHTVGRSERRTKHNSLAGRAKRGLKFRAAWLRALLGKHIGLQVEQDRVVGRARKLFLNARQRMVKVVLLQGC